LPPHVMEPIMEPANEPRRHQTSPGDEHQMLAVYVDDFVLAAVENKAKTLLKRTMRATLRAIHSIFPAPAAADPPGTKDPISEKKMLKGDASWNILKEILGYKFDGKARLV
jgi:hypothetical protein